MKELNTKPSEKYKAVLKAAAELAKAEGEEMASRACAEAMIDGKEQAFASRYKVQLRKDSHVCARRLMGRRCDREIEWQEAPLPGADHLSEWLKDGETHAIVSQPYGVSWKTLREIVRYCELNGLEADIDAGSWWFPGRTVALIYTRSEDPDPPSSQF